MAIRLAEIGEGLAIVPKRTVVANKDIQDIDVLSLDKKPVSWDIVVAYPKSLYTTD